MDKEQGAGVTKTLHRKDRINGFTKFPEICYAMLMNRMAETCASVSKDPNQSQIFLEELERIQQKMSSMA